jgi:peptidoglycan/LPS O-acetylase OafA/YrhL
LLLVERQSTGRVNLRRFYSRRIRRLVPALITVVAAYAVIAMAMGIFARYPGQAVITLAYGSNIAQALGIDLGPLAHTWSLSLEEQFYLLWPATLLLVRSRFALIVVALIGIVVGSLVLPGLRFDAVLWGCVAGLLAWRMSRAAAWIGWAVLALLLVAPEIETVTLVGLSMASVAIVSSAHAVGFLRHPLLVRIGQLSYGIYLWHYGPALLLQARTEQGDLIAQATVVVAGLALALVSERWIERPWRTPRHSTASTATLQVPIQAAQTSRMSWP